MNTVTCAAAAVLFAIGNRAALRYLTAVCWWVTVRALLALRSGYAALQCLHHT